MNEDVILDGLCGFRLKMVWVLMVFVMMVGVVVFLGLGIWQVQCLVWKIDLIVWVEVWVIVFVILVFGVENWDDIIVQVDEYCCIVVLGSFDYVDEVLVQVVILQGVGFWVMILLVMFEGWLVWINWGFVFLD